MNHFSKDDSHYGLTQFKILLTCTFLIASTACTAPYKQLDTQALRYGFVRQIIRGPEFSHLVYFNTDIRGKSTFHIYLGGDGIPWIEKRWVTNDPTPKKLVALDLMNLDKNPSIYIGRPCYHGLNKAHLCTSNLWTSDRYSKRVVDSMVELLGLIFRDKKDAKLVLIGHSGGGTLAMLLARYLENTRGVVTIAANLDIDAWTQLHGYSPLMGSINPAKLSPLRSGVFQIHLAGREDENVPVSLITPTVKRQPNASLYELEGQDHSCCWTKVWNDFLSEIEQH